MANVLHTIPDMETKVCAACKIEKPKSEYHKRTGKRCGVQSKCKECTAAYKKQRYWSNHEAELAKHTKSRLKPENVQQRKGYYEKNKEQYIERHNRYMSDEEKRQRKLQLSAKRYQENKEEIRARHKRNYERPEAKERLRERHHERKVQDVDYVIKRRLRFRLRHIVDRLGNPNAKMKSMIELIGCDLETFKQHIESLFTEGMTWEAVLKGEIHMDHKKPCALFDLSVLENQQACFHYTNIQPLWGPDNLSKGARYQSTPHER
jgi:hypothetical protein